MRKTLGVFIIVSLIATLSFTITHLLSIQSEVQTTLAQKNNELDTSLLELPQTSLLKDSTGKTFYAYSTPNRTSIPLREMPAFLLELFIQSEDRSFYEHNGFDASAISRAFILNAKNSAVEQGGSTITQQVVKNIYLSNEQTYSRKLNELKLSYQLEKARSKEQILELYVNAIYFGNGAYGIEAAAQTYFNRSTAELSKAQLAFLAAIPNNPTIYNPKKHFDATKERQGRLLQTLAQQGVITFEEAKEIEAEKITLKERSKTTSFPSYASYVEAELSELVSVSEGLSLQSEKEREVVDKRVQTLLSQGVTVHTSLLPDMQQKAEQAVKMVGSADGLQGASVVIDHRTNRIVAITGGVHYQKGNFHRGYQAVRQPGSAIKPLLSFAPYVERTKASITDMVEAKTTCFTKTYCPSNYGGASYGQMTLQSALAKSVNTAAVKLLQEVTPEEAWKDIQKFSFEHLLPADARLPSALGGLSYGVTPLELTQAYTIFSRSDYAPARAITKVTSASGELLYEWKEKPVQVWSKETIRTMRQLLEGVVKNGTARSIYTSESVRGGKTGTTNDYFDFWYVGYNEAYTSGVWVGKDTPSSLKALEGKQYPLRIWEETITK